MIRLIPCFVVLTLTLSSLYAQPKRAQVDSVGFAVFNWQMDSVIKRLSAQKNPDSIVFAVCPHDDYLYAGQLYNDVFSRIKAETIIIIAVAHKAKKFGVERKIVFDSFLSWNAPYGDVFVSPLRQVIIKYMNKEDYIINDSLQGSEHSAEALLPFIQYYNRNARIVPVLIPYMPIEDIYRLTDEFSNAVHEAIKEQGLIWGKDVAMIVSSDAVHYGDEGWGDKNYAPMGCDSAGYNKAVAKEKQIIDECLKKPVQAGAEMLFSYTVQENDWHEYKWTWCGRYSVPFGLLTVYKLQLLNGKRPLSQAFVRYSTSIDHTPLKVDDIKMGATAPANLHHWVGYIAVGYK